MRVASLAALLLAGHCVSPVAAAFNFDTNFNATGKAQDWLDLGASKADLFADVTMAPATGAFYSVGRVESVSAGGPTFGVMFKRLQNGAKDASFGSGGSSRVQFAAERSGGSSGIAAVAFDASNNGAVIAAGFNDLANGKRCGVVYKVFDNAVAKGVLDASYGTSGRYSYCAPIASAIEFSDVKVLADGRALVAGNGTLASGEAYGFLLRLTATGQADATFNGGAPLAIDIRANKDDYALRIALAPQGYYVGGNTVYSRQPAGSYFDDDIDLWVARVTTWGALDSNFNGNGKRIEAIDLYGTDKTDLLADLTVDSAGRVLLLANVNPAHLIYNANGDVDPLRTGRSQGLVIRLTIAGARDAAFGGGTGARSVGSASGGCAGNHFCDYDEPASIVTAPNNGILVTGRYVRGGFLGAVPVSHLSLNSLDSTGFSGAGQVFFNWPRSEGASMVRQADGMLAIGGLVRTSTTISDVDFAVFRFQAP